MLGAFFEVGKNITNYARFTTDFGLKSVAVRVSSDSTFNVKQLSSGDIQQLKTIFKEIEFTEEIPTCIVIGKEKIMLCSNDQKNLKASVYAIEDEIGVAKSIGAKIYMLHYKDPNIRYIDAHTDCHVNFIQLCNEIATIHSDMIFAINFETLEQLKAFIDAKNNKTYKIMENIKASVSISNYDISKRGDSSYISYIINATSHIACIIYTTDAVNTSIWHSNNLNIGALFDFVRIDDIKDIPMIFVSDPNDAILLNAIQDVEEDRIENIIQQLTDARDLWMSI